MEMKTVHYFEVSIARKDEKAQWLLGNGEFETAIDAQMAAIANGQHPWRLRKKSVAVKPKESEAAA